jgi:hypothetical protein
MRALLLLPLLLLSACSTLFGTDDPRRLVLANRTDNALLYVAFGSGPVVDPQPALEFAENRDRMVAAGEQRAIEVSSYTGEGVTVFVYEIPSQDHAGAVPLTRTLRVSERDLARTHGRIIVDEE